MAVLPLRIQVRRDQDSLFNSENPLLLEGEIAYSIDKNKVKIGDGINRWQALDYLDDELTARVDVLTADATVDGSVDYKVAAEAKVRLDADTALSVRLDTLEGDDSVAGSVDGKVMVEALARQAGDAELQVAINTLQADVDANEVASNTTDSGLQTQIDTLTTTVAVNKTASETADAAIQADVDANEADGDAADAALQAAIVTVQADVDANEADSDAADAALQAAIDAEIARVDALVATDMWLFADQSAFPSASANHGRIVHSHADASMFYAHAGLWHKIEREDEAQAARDTIDNTVNQKELQSITRDDNLQTNIDTVESAASTQRDLLQTNINNNEVQSISRDDALSARSTALEDTLNGAGSTADSDGIANKANYAYSAIVTTPDGIHAKITALETDVALKANAADLSNVDNTSDANKPVSTATQTALDLKANATDTALTGTTTVSILEGTTLRGDTLRLSNAYLDSTGKVLLSATNRKFRGALDNITGFTSAQVADASDAATLEAAIEELQEALELLVEEVKNANRGSDTTVVDAG